MKVLALDIGTRRTGVAYLDSEVGIPLPLDTLIHTTDDMLNDAVLKIVRERKIDRVIVGLPLLPSGEEGAQAAVSRRVGERIAQSGVAMEYRDERYTTPNSTADGPPPSSFDGDAAAACKLLNQPIR